MTVTMLRRGNGMERRALSEAARLANRMLTAARRPCSRGLDRIQATLSRAESWGYVPDEPMEPFSLSTPELSDEAWQIIEEAKRRPPARHFEKSSL